jgi:hypothetical protein
MYLARNCGSVKEFKVNALSYSSINVLAEV